jgi:hypothetical protein
VAEEGGVRDLALEVRVLIWGKGGRGAHWGGLAVVKLVGGREPAMAGRRRGGECWLRVRRAAVSSGGCRCGDGGARRWSEVRSTGRQPRQPKEAAGSVLRRFLAADGGSAASLAWLGGTRERCGVVGASALGGEECGNEGAEMDGESRAEWACIQRLSQEEVRRLLLRTDSAMR